MSIAIKLNDVSFQYPSNEKIKNKNNDKQEKSCRILNHVNIEFESGELCAIIGSNGAGKSTLAKIIDNLLQPTSGDITIEGKQYKTLKQHDITSLVGYIFQNPNDQIFNSTVHKEITYGIKNINNDIYSRVLNLTGLNDKENTNPFNLSFAERKFINIASALLREPHIIIMDEVTGGLDKPQKMRLVKILNYLHTINVTVLFITHDMEFAYENCQNALILDNGNVLYKGSIESAFQNVEIIKRAHIDQPIIVHIMNALGINYMHKDNPIRALAKYIANRNNH
ncbi:energy-coupling factor ABC transporter ATP-binding protein [Gardnerella vaginalis]|uniref:energy-coupling factor ABC transporter ATP-binding protein n=1 Tax=Gardnerella vaginalis TaxID=2702 RepID=UPI0002633D2F|nr:ABC transporter ATP-binding protein [Gardnerella vaginalis]EIK75555.1 cobalt ABC transporter ATP-binding protein [Gardnerella vaginalis 284V]